MMLFVFGLVYAALHPVSIGNNQYVNQDPIIGAYANTAESAQKIMQKLIDTQAVQLDAYNSVFNRSDLFNGFIIYAAKVQEGHTIFNYSQAGDTARVQYRFILSFVWEKAKQYTQDFIRETEQIIAKAFSALRTAPQYFARNHAPEKPKEVLIAELKAQNPDHVSVIVKDPADSIDPVSMGNNQYVNKTPMLGACADTEGSARKIMQKLVETRFVQLDAYTSVFTRPDIFNGFTIHAAKIHEGHTIFNYSRVGDRAAAQYRFILSFAWERAKQYTYDFIRATEQIVSKAFSALLGAPQYFIQHPVPEKLKVGFIDQLSSHLDRVRNEYTRVSAWNPAQIKSWKQAFIQQPIGYRNIHEMLAVLMRGAELSHGYVPRNVQILSVLSCLYQRGKGQFLQVKTGEGKSLITAMLAASKVLLEDIPVDVLSSSVVLAARDAALQQKFYSMFDITAGFKDKRLEGAFDFYQKHQVIYSDMSQLIGDTLRQSYMGHPTRGNRRFAALIIDEVDSLLVDRASEFVKLTTPLACSESLLPFLQLLWLQLNELVPTGAGIIQEEKIEQILQEFCENILNGTHRQFQLTVPAFLKEFARKQIPHWIHSARQAQLMQNGIHYLYLKNNNPSEPGTIKIVDFEHTGVTHENMVWGHGLHQFLQLKHDGCVYPETLTSCFASTDAYISRYQKNVFGLTGTLGDPSTRQFIQKTHGVTLLDIPSYTAKTFTEYPGRLCAHEEAWKIEVIDAIQKETRKGRAVLVVNANIATCCALKELLTSAYPAEKLRLYVHGSQTNVLDSVKPGTVILTTNLGGRGTDLETTPEIEQAGGLHVLVTFLPANQRVEDQGFGRTSRQGRKGSAQLLVLKDLAVQTVAPFTDQTDTIDQLRAMRKLKEDQRVKSIQHETMSRMRLNDQLFHRVDTYMGSLLQGVPLQDHPEKEKIKQVDQLWALQQNRLESYKDEINRVWKQDLRQQLKKWDLTLTDCPQTALDSLYTLAHLTTAQKHAPSAAALKAKALSYLLAQKRSWADFELNQLADRCLDTRNPSDALLEALCQATRSTYVCIDQAGRMRIARYHDDTAPVVCLGGTEGQAAIPDLSVLKALYPSMAFAQPVRLEASQMPSSLCPVVFTNAQISDELRACIQKAPKIAVTTYNFEGGDHPKVQDVLTKMEQKEQQWHTRFYDQEGRYQIQWVNQFIENLKTLYTQGDLIFVTPAYLAQLASQTKLPSAAETLFARAVNIPHLHRAMTYYSWANYIVRNQVGSYKVEALRKLEECAAALQEQIQLWQYISIFSGEQSSNNPIGYQVRGRLGLYSHMLSNIQQNIQAIRSAGAKDKIVIHSEESLAGLANRMPYFKEADVEQVRHLGLNGFSSYSVTPPESSFFDVFLVNVLGVFQTVVGAVLTTAGVPFGSAVLMSGLNDIWTGVKSMVTGVFSWENYFFDKSIDLLTTAVSHMYGVIKSNVLKVKNVASAVVAQKSVMDTIVQAAKTTLVKNITAEVRTRAVTLAVSGLSDNMHGVVQTKVDQLMSDATIRTQLEHLEFISTLLREPAVIAEMMARITAHAVIQQRDVCQILGNMTKRCIAEHHSGSALGTVISTAVSGVQLARQHQDVTTCVDKYIQMLREEIMRTAQAIPTIDTVLSILYRSACSAEPPSDMSAFLSHLRAAGIIVGDRPYNIQRYGGGAGIQQYSTERDLAERVKHLLPLSMHLEDASREALAMYQLGMGTLRQRRDILVLQTLMLSLIKTVKDGDGRSVVIPDFKKVVTDLGTKVLFNKTISFADGVVSETMQTAQNVMQVFRTRLAEVQKDYQALEHAEQLKIAEQKRIDQAKVAAAEQKARQEEAARRAALEKDTAYTRTLEQRLQAGHPDHSDTLRQYYAPEALAANANRKKDEKAVPLVDPKALEERESGIRVPIPNLPFGMMPMVFASAGIPVGGLPGLTPFVFPNGMVITKDGNGIPVLRTPGGEGVSNDVDVGSFPVQRRQPDVTGIPGDAPQKPDATGIPAAPSEERGPQVGVFPRTPVTEPTILMAKKSGDAVKQGGETQESEQKLLWSSWSDYPKVSLNGKEYARIGDRLYTRHAIDMTQPSGLGAPAGSLKSGRSFPIDLVEHVIQTGEQKIVVRDGQQRVIHSLGKAEVITESNGKIVITVHSHKEY